MSADQHVHQSGQPSEMEIFLQEIKPNQPSPNDNLCIRFLRRKYRCLILLFLILYLFLQLSIIIVNKTEGDSIRDLINQNNNTKLYWDNYISRLTRAMNRIVKKINYTETIVPH